MKRDKPFDLDWQLRQLGLTKEEMADLLNRAYSIWLREHKVSASQENMIEFIVDLQANGWLPSRS